MISDRTLGDRIKYRRYLEKMHINELAAITGLSKHKLEAFEADLEIPNSKAILKLTQAFNVNCAYLFRYDLDLPLEVKCA